ncbi:hypothetical protein HED60_23090 [Planctomycetales bacterium ZRK34]|nr:hypothetical protein HED60_23090 [Planctomycetales bacterium ZRK34]
MGIGRFRKSRWFWPITIAVLAHVTLGVFLLYQKLEIGAKPGPKSKLVDLSAARQNSDGTGEIEPAELDKQLDAGLAKTQAMDPRQREAITRERLDWIEKHSSVESVDAMSRVVKQSVGAPQRAYEPVEPAPPGSFDIDSMLPYASKKEVFDDGIVRSVQTWVDKDGRVMKQTIRRSKDDNGVLKEYRGTYSADGKFFETEVPVADDGGLNSVVEMMSRSEILQKLFTGAVLPALESQSGKKQTEKPGTTTSSP